MGKHKKRIKVFLFHPGEETVQKVPLDFKDTKKLLGIGFEEGAGILAVMDVNSNVLSKETIDIGAFLKKRILNKDISAIAEKIEEKTIFKGIQFFLIGMALPPWMDRISAKGIDILAGEIGRVFGSDVMVSKRATAAAYAERELGHRTKGKDILFMHLDIGDGVVIKDSMIYEASAAEGIRGVRYLKPWAQFSMAESAKSLVAKGVGTDIVDLVKGDINKITLDVVLNAAERRDELARDLVKRSGYALGVRVAYLVNMFGPKVVILGGGTERSSGDFIKFVKDSANRFLCKSLKSKLRVVCGILEKEASALGAALLCRRNLFREVSNGK
ncbi:MAG: ROK family protein [Candidatus Omnitrophota bacterium]